MVKQRSDNKLQKIGKEHILPGHVLPISFKNPAKTAERMPLQPVNANPDIVHKPPEKMPQANGFSRLFKHTESSLAKTKPLAPPASDTQKRFTQAVVSKTKPATISHNNPTVNNNQTSLAKPKIPSSIISKRDDVLNEYQQLLANITATKSKLEQNMVGLIEQINAYEQQSDVSLSAWSKKIDELEAAKETVADREKKLLDIDLAELTISQQNLAAYIKDMEAVNQEKIRIHKAAYDLIYKIYADTEKKVRFILHKEELSKQYASTLKEEDLLLKGQQLVLSNVRADERELEPPKGNWLERIERTESMQKNFATGLYNTAKQTYDNTKQIAVMQHQGKAFYREFDQYRDETTQQIRMLQQKIHLLEQKQLTLQHELTLRDLALKEQEKKNSELSEQLAAVEEELKREENFDHDIERPAILAELVMKQLEGIKEVIPNQHNLSLNHSYIFSVPLDTPLKSPNWRSRVSTPISTPTIETSKF